MSISTHHIRDFAQESAFVLLAFTLSSDSLATQQSYVHPYQKERVMYCHYVIRKRGGGANKLQGKARENGVYLNHRRHEGDVG